jgi:hypothetical protein
MLLHPRFVCICAGSGYAFAKQNLATRDCLSETSMTRYNMLLHPRFVCICAGSGYAFAKQNLATRDCLSETSCQP